MPKIQYPAVFENGLTGMSCKENIESGEAMIMVPQKMVMSISKAKNHPILKVVYEENANVFEN